MSAPETRFTVLLFTDIVGSADLKVKHGVPAYSEALRTHNGHFERLARECHITILQNMGDGYFAEAGGIAEAVRFALLFQDAMREGPWGEVCLATRVGIHAGEVSAVDSEGGSGIVSPAADLTARVMSLALGGQILLTRFPFDEARHFIREHPAVVGKAMPPLRWLAHGPYLMKGRDEPLDIFEIGAEGLAPLVAPPDAEKAKRAIRPGEEETLGWRPAIGLEIPGRPGWHLTGLLGAGGFGEVWAGEHAKLRQRRAFKFCFDDERLRALKREVTLVRLLGSALGERDDIVKIHELKLDAPPFYLESDLAPHGNLLQWAEKQGGLDKIPMERRIALVAHTATALAAAHSIGVLHKDIKPTNILIFDGPDGEPRPRLVDFGIGALADPAVLAQHGVTAAGFTRATIQHSTGTPTYSPPEYLAGRPYTIQGDIYGLGVLLYQLVTAKPLDPLAPGWERDIPDPLLIEDIAVCVDGDPARRLFSATELAERLLGLDQRRIEIEAKEQLERAQVSRAAAEAIAATARQRAARLRKLTAAFAVFAGLAITGGSLAWINQRKAIKALGEVERSNTEIERKKLQYRAMLAEAARSDRFVAEEKLQSGLECEALAHLARACEYDPGSTLAAEKTVAALNDWHHPIPRSILTEHEGGVQSVQFSMDGMSIVTASDDHTAKVWNTPTGKCLATLRHADNVISAQFSSDCKRIVTASKDGTARVWDAVSGSAIATLNGHGSSVGNAQFSPDGARIVTASDDRTARVWDAATGRSIAVLSGHEDSLSSAQFSPNGTHVVTASDDKTARVWDAATGLCIAILNGHEGWLKSAHFSPDGRCVITASEDKTARIWDATTGRCIATLSGHHEPLMDAQFSPDGKRIVTASWDKTAQVWDAESGRNLANLSGHKSELHGAQFSPDGARIVTASEDRTARVWDVATGRCVATLSGHSKALPNAQFSPDGDRLVTVSLDKTVRIWDTDNCGNIVTLSGHDGWLKSAEFSPDGARIVTAADDQTARVWDAGTGRSIVTLRGHQSSVISAQFRSDGMRIVTASWDKTAKVWDAALGTNLVNLAGHDSLVTSAEFSPEGARVVTASEDKTARVWDAATGGSIAILSGHESSVSGAQFSPDGVRVVTASEDRTARVWDAATGRCIVILSGHEGSVSGAQFSPDGVSVVTASDDNTAQVWDAATGKRIATLRGHELPVKIAQFSMNGARIITASDDRTARVWDVATGRGIATLSGHEFLVRSAEFSPDGNRVVTASWDETARVWDAKTGGCIATLSGHQEPLTNTRFSPDGARVVTASWDKTARVWITLPPSAGPPPAWFPDFLRYMAQMRLSADGELVTCKPDDWLALRERMRAVRRANSANETSYLGILRRHVSE